MKHFVYVLLFASVLCGCGRQDVTGEWELVNAKTGAAYGDVMTLNKGGSWHRTGFPAMAGTYDWFEGNLAFKVLEVGGIDRAESVKAGKGVVDVEAQLKKIEQQMVFQVVAENDNIYMKQTSEVDGLPILQLRKKH